MYVCVYMGTHVVECEKVCVCIYIDTHTQEHIILGHGENTQ
jgi:hypothetical protein